MNLQLTLNKPEIFRNVFSPSIFTWDDVDICVNNLLTYINAKKDVTGNYIDLINHITGEKNESPIPYEIYDWSGPTYNIAYIFERIKLGDSFIIYNLSRYNKDINNICKSLEEMTGNPSDAHLYGGLYTHSKSFGKHKDIPHNLIIQFEGTCSWRIWQKEVLVIDDILYPGDTIYVPASFYHEAIPTGRRLSISFPFGYPEASKTLDRNWYTLR
jgi:ribosomal protein L16 Arg81 hydroxylase